MAIHYEQPLDRIFHALGDGTRRRILGILAADGSCSANELGAPFDIAQPTVSKHLKVLEKAGLVKRGVQGRTHRFELDIESMDEAANWITRHQAFWQNSLGCLEDFLGGSDASGIRQ